MSCLLTVSANGTFLLYKLATMTDIDDEGTPNTIYFGTCGEVQTHDISQSLGANEFIDVFNALIKEQSAVVLTKNAEQIFNASFHKASSNYQFYIWDNQNEQPYEGGNVSIAHNENDIGEYDHSQILYVLLKREGSALARETVSLALHKGGKLVFNDRAIFPGGTMLMTMNNFACPNVFDNKRIVIV